MRRSGFGLSKTAFDMADMNTMASGYDFNPARNPEAAKVSRSISKRTTPVSVVVHKNGMNTPEFWKGFSDKLKSYNWRDYVAAGGNALNSAFMNVVPRAADAVNHLFWNFPASAANLALGTKIPMIPRNRDWYTAKYLPGQYNPEVSDIATSVANEGSGLASMGVLGKMLGLGEAAVTAGRVRAPGLPQVVAGSGTATAATKALDRASTVADAADAAMNTFAPSVAE